LTPEAWDTSDEGCVEIHILMLHVAECCIYAYTHTRISHAIYIYIHMLKLVINYILYMTTNIHQLRTGTNIPVEGNLPTDNQFLGAAEELVRNSGNERHI